MAGYRIAWLEEPLPPDDHAAYLRLKEKDIVPLAAGEHEPSEERYLDLILTEAVDYVQMDVCCQGGYAMGRRLFAEIARQGLRFAFHSWGTALEVVAAAHLGICWPDMVVEWLEYPCYSSPDRAGMYPFPLAAEILKEPLKLDAGDLIVPRETGAGRGSGRIGGGAVSVDPGPLVVLPHRFAAREPGRHGRSQREVDVGQRSSGSRRDDVFGDGLRLRNRLPVFPHAGDMHADRAANQVGSFFERRAGSDTSR